MGTPKKCPVGTACAVEAVAPDTYLRRVSEEDISLEEAIHQYGPDVIVTTFTGRELDPAFEHFVVTASDFPEKTITNGASLFIYQVSVNGSSRASPGKAGHGTAKRDRALPFDLHFLITLWGGKASHQHSLAGWIMRVLEDTPVLPASVLNSVISGVFREEESVQIVPADLTAEDLFRIWAGIGNNTCQLSVPYVAGVVHIESEG